jgi:vitellogenic carboxypeptidase-like protein
MLAKFYHLQLYDNLLTGLLTPNHKTYFTKVTGASYYFNFLWYDTPPDFGYYFRFLDLPHVRKAIHVGNAVFHNSTKVQTVMHSDLTKSVKPEIEAILDAGYKVLFANGQLDISVAFELTQYFVQKLHWRYDAGFQSSPRDKWKNGTEISGYIQRHKNLALALVLNAGHMIPYDQPSKAFDLINLFTSGRII